MGIGQIVRERATNATRILIDGEPVNPWLVGIDFTTKGSTPQQVELRLGLPILIFELQQCDVNVEKSNILAFVLDDLKDHRDSALDGYLTIVRHVVNPPPRRKSLGWFARMFTPPPKWVPPAPEWKWTTIDETKLSDEDTLVLKGTCYKIAGSVLG